MPRKRTYKQSQIDELRRKLQEATAPERELTTQQGIAALKDDLLEKQRQGWTLKELAQWLSTANFTISSSQLGDYLNEGPKGKGTKKARTNTDSKPKIKVTKRVTRTDAALPEGANVTQPDGTPELNERKVTQKRLPIAELQVGD